MVEYGFRHKAQICTPFMLRHIRMLDTDAADVRLVNDRVFPRDFQPAVVSPGEPLFGNDAQRRIGRAIRR